MKTVNVYANDLSDVWTKELLPDDLFEGDIIDIDFNGCQMIRIERQGEIWVVTNAMDGWGDNNYDSFNRAEVDVITQLPFIQNDRK